MIKRMIIMLTIVGLILIGIFGFINFKARMIKQYMSAQGEPLQTVSTTTANYSKWTSMLDTVATLKAAQGINISAEVSGMVAEIYFEEGETVTKGTPIIQLRDHDDKAKLEALKATAELTKTTYNRDLAQFNINAISKQTLDIDKANVDIANANISQQQAIVNKKLILAPFSGKLGIRLIDIGQYIEPGTPITTLQDLDTIFVDFYLPQQALSRLKIGQKVIIQTDSFPNQEFIAEIKVINPKIEVNTRNISIRAALKNQHFKLLPGMYVTIKINLNTDKQIITLPRTAISFNAFGAHIYRIENNNKDKKDPTNLIAKQSTITTGETRGDQIAILSGVKEGDIIVTTGQIKLHNGSPVRIDNSIQPLNEATPQPIDQ